MATQSIAQVVQQLRTKPKPTDAASTKRVVNADMAEMAGAIKEYMLAELALNSKHPLKPGGVSEAAVVSGDAEKLEIQLPAYAESIDKGRKPGGKKVPIAAIIGWLKRYQVTTGKRRTGSLNSAAFAIQQVIYRNGIKARPFIDATLKYRDELVHQVVEQVILPQITSSLDLIFP